MNTKHHYFRLLRTFALAALTAAAIAACSDDNGDPDGREPLTPPDANPGIPVTFTADINPGSDADPAAAPDTRTVLTPTTEGGFTVAWKGKDNNPTSGYDLIHIRAAQGTTTIGSKTYVPTTSGASSELVPENDQDPLTLTQTGEWTFTAIYGENVSGNGMAASMVSPLSQSAPNNTEHIAAADFSVATATQNIASADDEMPQDIRLRFEHKLSALQLHVTNQSGKALTVREIRLSVTGDQIACERAYDVATGDWKADEEQTSDYLKLTIDAPEALAKDGSTAQDFHMLLFPGYSDKRLTITVITSRGEYTLTKKAPDGGFAAGHNYMVDDIVIRTSGLTADETWTETISNKAELAAFRERVNNGNDYSGKTVRLTANIDLSGETWTTAIGNDKQPFQGTFDGGGYLISNLTMDNRRVYAGLFCYVDGGTVRNLRVSGTVKTNKEFAGGIVGLLKGSTVENCMFNGTVYSPGYVGGIAGELDGSTVKNCIFGGTVSGPGHVGGIAGYSLNNSRIAGCYTKGKVTVTTAYAGGIAGSNVGSVIDGCYSEAEVTASLQYAGGISGTNENGGTITHCYATGKVSGKSYVGGIVGHQSSSTLTGCIALNPGLTSTEGTDVKFGRIVGKNGGTVTSCAAFEGMMFTDNANQPITGTTGEAGTLLTAAACLTPATYTTLGFTAATATTAGWAFDDTAAPWTYLPWNPAFESFPGITDPNLYRIAVPVHLGIGVN